MKCPTCGKKKKIYYGEWCPKCEKPELEVIAHLNFIKCLDYLEANGNAGIKSRLWDYCLDDLENDKSFTLSLELYEDEEDADPQIVADLKLIQTVWDIKEDSIVMDVSW